MVITSRTRNAVIRKLVQGFESLSLRQRKKSTFFDVDFFLFFIQICYNKIDDKYKEIIFEVCRENSRLLY